MALCCRQSAVSPRAHGLTNARWQLVHGDPNPWRPKTIAQRCGALIAASASAGSAFLSPLKILSFGNDRANSIWSQAQHTREIVAIVEPDWGDQDRQHVARQMREYHRVDESDARRDRDRQKIRDRRAQAAPEQDRRD